MNSDGSSSESDISVSSGESYVRVHRSSRRNGRRSSIDSVCTDPKHDAYVMVLQNRKDLYDDLKCAMSVKDLCDVTFLCGPERKPVYGIRALIGTRSRLFYQLILSHEKNRRLVRQENKSTFRKTFSKLRKLACVPVQEDLMTSPPRRKSSLIIPIEAFDANTFERFMNYVHCGSLIVDSSTVVGLMNASYMFGFPEIQQACWDFAVGCAAREDNLEDMLTSAGMYADHKMTKLLMRTVSTIRQVRHSQRERERQRERQRELDTIRAENERERMRDRAQDYPDLLANHSFRNRLESFDEEEEDMLVT